MSLKNISELCQNIRDGALSAESVTREYLKKTEACNKSLNAYIAIDAEAAIENARSIDARILRGENVGELCGAPFAVKDNLCTRTLASTCGSNMLAGYIPPYTATAVERLLDKGAVMLGKTNMDEFGMGSTTENAAYGRTYNPLDITRTSGGSSGGSAAAVSAGLCAFALGSDTGGSVRLPAAFCGCVGLKPTYGAVSRYGLVSFASSLDTVGVLSACVDDCERVFSVIRGRDELDATSAQYIPFCRDTSRPLRIGLCRDIISSASKPIADGVYAAAEILRKRGLELFDISLPDKDTAASAYYVISCAEASSNLGRYDGIRYGHRAKDAENLHDLYVNSRGEGFGDEVCRRIMLGTYCLHGDGRMDYYSAAYGAKRDIEAKMKSVLKSCDVILLPTSHTQAPRIDEQRTHLSVWRDDAFCLFASLSGLPALTVPCGAYDGMPIGVQLIANAFDEKTLFSVGRMLEVTENEE